MTEVTLTVDGQAVTAIRGTSLTGVLRQAGVWRTRTHLVTGEARGPFCGMGICFECEVRVDDQPPVRACLVRVEAGQTVTTDA
jgi:D-hydroxyproline dehydrogenase subunit gamma